MTYLLSDHLGSTSLTTDASGNLVSEMRYKAWGEVRYSSGTTSTDYTYTGQYSNMGDFGLMFYNARWYDPALGRFAQADSIVPGGVQGLDRYAYVNNSPLNFVDPSGHDPWWLPQDLQDDYWQNSWLAQSSNLDSGNDGEDEDGIDLKDMTTSDKGEDFIKYWEDIKLNPYPDMGGNCTIGWGHVLPNDGNGCSGWPKKTYGKGITTQDAQKFFDDDIAKFVFLINRTIKVDLTQGQFDALVSYTFNSGDQTNQPYFEKHLPELINSRDFEAAAEAIRRGPITSGNLESPRLVERRQYEAYLFLNNIYLVP